MVAEDMNATIKINVLYIINYIVIIKLFVLKKAKRQFVNRQFVKILGKAALC